MGIPVDVVGWVGVAAILALIQLAAKKRLSDPQEAPTV